MPRPRKTPLRAVTAADCPTVKPTVKSLKAAAEAGERELLATMRAKIAGDLDNGVPPAALAPLYRQLRLVDSEIRQLDLRAEQQAILDDGSDCDDESWSAASI